MSSASCHSRAATKDVTVGEHDWLAGRLEENRAHLRSVAYRMLGSLTEADDAVQETWLRLSRADTGDIQNGQLFSVMGFTAKRGTIVEIDILVDPARLRQLDLAILND